MEPPETNGGHAPAGGTDGGGTGGAGGGGGTGGFSNPQGGAGGLVDAGTGGLNPAAGAGGAAGMGVTGGMGASGTGGAAGFGGAGGAGGGMGGTGADSDAGVDSGADPEAPVLECEEGRDTVMLFEALLAGAMPFCTAQLPNDALEGGAMALAVTSLDEGSGAETTWAVRKNGADECDEGDAFYVDLTLAVPRVTLCPAFCDALVATGVETVKLELIYGCESPE